MRYLLWSALAAIACNAVAAPRNVVLFVGDGMGVSTVTAARILAGQLEGKAGEEHELSFEAFPNVALIKTYNTDLQVPDSAGTMTALVTGEKTRAGVLSVGASVPRGDCEAALANPLPTLLEMAERRGLRTGIVSTARITHATPAATYAHAPDRDWENDASVPESARELGCRDIARQMIEFSEGDGIDVMLGGGRRDFFPADVKDPEYRERSGVRTDERNLVEEWLASRADRFYAWRSKDLKKLARKKDVAQVLGLFEPSHMKWEADRGNDGKGEPSLAEMTDLALDYLENDKGFFLMVEGGRIDHGHHAGNAYRALTDTLAMDAAVRVVMSRLDPAQTLVIVTADHSHTLTISGYPRRGNPILGLAEISEGVPMPDYFGKPYTVLGYQNGPGYRAEIPDLTEVDTTSVDYKQVAAVPLASETHGGEDVAAYGWGVAADGVRGVMEQNRLYHVMAEALFGDDQ